MNLYDSLCISMYLSGSLSPFIIVKELAVQCPVLKNIQGELLNTARFRALQLQCSCKMNWNYNAVQVALVRPLGSVKYASTLKE